MDGLKSDKSGASGRNPSPEVGDAASGIGAGTPAWWCRYMAAEWRRYLVGADQPVTAYPGDDLPREGVYFLWTADWGLEYIGISSGIEYRLLQHTRAGRVFKYVGVIEIEDAWAREVVETAYIEALAPAGNGRRGYARFSKHEEMVAAIRELWAPQLAQREAA